MLFAVVLFLMTLTVAALLLSALVPARAIVRFGCIVNAVQLHSVSLVGIYPSLALLSWLALWRTALSGALWRWGWMQILLGLALAQALSILWAPAPLAGVRHLIYFLPLLLVSHAFYGLTLQRASSAQKCLHALLAGSALVAVLVIVFRLLPGLEHTFLLSPFARLLISPNTLDALFDGWRNNVLDPAKAGGIFVNANIASAYLGMSAVAAWYVGRAHASKFLRTVAMLDWVAVAFTGSKAGLVCALIVPLAMMTITVAQRRKAHPLSFVGVTLTLACVVVVMLLPIGRETLEAYGSETSATFGTREQIWQFAWQMARQHPFTGLGFGGWEQRFQLPAMLQGFAVSIPPHNSLFILWLQSGALGLAAGTAFVFAVFAAGWRAARTHSLLAMATAGAFAWYLIQGMGENFGLVGEIHMTPLLGALLGYSCAQHDNVSVPHECGVKILRSPDPSPALPAV